MSYFKTKMHQIRFRVSFAPEPIGVAIERSPTTAFIFGAYF